MKKDYLYLSTCIHNMHARIPTEMSAIHKDHYKKHIDF